MKYVSEGPMKIISPKSKVFLFNIWEKMKGLEKDCKAKINRKLLQGKTQVMERVCEDLFVFFPQIHFSFNFPKTLEKMVTRTN